ncbi:MAG TPA: hypothetical protein PKI76_03405 [Oscillospiraceae bacterium]|nr:hypothetical protein [Oscillospiraceae bacterium]HNW04414.1 hypothetical protein [Oscillospiraceae bacterium]
MLLLSACLYLLFAGPAARAKRETAALTRYFAALASGKPPRLAKLRRLTRCDEATALLVRECAALAARRPERAGALLPPVCILLEEKERGCDPSDAAGRLFYLRLLGELEPDPSLYERRVGGLPDCPLRTYELKSVAGR